MCVIIGDKERHMAKKKAPAKKIRRAVRQLHKETDRLAVKSDHAKKQMDKVQRTADSVTEKARKLDNNA